MPRYIDLLRAHKNGSPDSTTAAKAPQSSWDNRPGAAPEQVKPRSNRRAPGSKISGRRTPDRKSDQVIADTDVWLSQCMRIILSFLKAASNRKVVQIGRLWKHMKPQVAAILSDQKRLSALELKVSGDTRSIREMSDEFGGMLEKSMNMLLLSMKIGLQLRLEEKAILSLLLAGMLHHAGLARVPVAIRQKTSALTREERLSIRNATHEGVEYLRACGISDTETLLAIEQSQERIDGSGPLGLSGDEISYMARIVGLLSFFEALIHYRPYRQRMLPRDAIRDIILHHKSAFDTSLLKALIDAASLYPIGTYVQLNSGDIGQVIHIHSRLPLRPTIRLCRNRAGQPIEPREIDLQVQTTLLVERCMYPEDIDTSL